MVIFPLLGATVVSRSCLACIFIAIGRYRGRNCIGFLMKYPAGPCPDRVLGSELCPQQVYNSSYSSRELFATGTRPSSVTPETRQARKGNQWFCGKKTPIGVDAVTGLTHRVAATSTNIADVTMAGPLVRDDDDDQRVNGDAGHLGMESIWAKKRTPRTLAAVSPQTRHYQENGRQPMKALLLEPRRPRPASVPRSSIRVMSARISLVTGRFAKGSGQEPGAAVHPRQPDARGAVPRPS